MDELELGKMEDGLNLLMNKFKQNNHSSDSLKLKAIVQAKNAIRIVMLHSSLNGDITFIKPIFEEKRGYGWFIILANGAAREIYPN